jgi:hypothetical protein
MNLFILITARFPVSGATAPMGYSDDLDGCCCLPVNYGVGKAPQEKLPRTVQVHRPALRPALDLTNRVVEFGYESVCRGRISLGIPLIGSSRLGDSFGMELSVWTSHEPARESDVARRTKEPSSQFPYPTHRCGARFLFPNPLPRFHPPSHPSCQADDPRARHVLPEANGGLLLKLFCASDSSPEFYISPSHQHKFQVARNKCQSSYRCRRPHVLLGGPSGQLPARSHLRG